MSNNLLASGYGNVLAYISGHTNVLPTINNIANSNKPGDIAVSTSQTLASVWEMIGKELPVIKLAGKALPATALSLSIWGIINDYLNLYNNYYNNNGTISTSNIYSALGNLTSAASAITLTAAIAGTATAPLVAFATLLTITGAVLSIASVAAKGEINFDAVINDIREAVQPIKQAAGELYDSAIDNLIKQANAIKDGAVAVNDFIADAVEALIDDLNDFSQMMADMAAEAMHIAAEAAAQLLAQAASIAADPLILDLDGDGIVTSDRPVYFDHDGDGFAQLSGWAGKNDGLLALDKNGNGKIDNGNELFGNHTQTEAGITAENGFQALESYDANHDGVINAEDDIFADLKIWQDRNSNGVTDEGELISLEQAGIASINLSYDTFARKDSYGNQVMQQGSYQLKDGSQHAMVDVWFREDNIRTQDLNSCDLPEDILSLPELAGTGNVSSLHQTIARNPESGLRELLQQFSEAATHVERYQLADKIVIAWSGALNHASDSQSSYIDAQKLYALEAFAGSYQFHAELIATHWASVGDEIDMAWQQFVKSVYGQLMLQTHLSEYMAALNYSVENGAINLDASKLLPMLRSSENMNVTLAELYSSLLWTNTHSAKDIIDELKSVAEISDKNIARLLSLFSQSETFPALEENGFIGSSNNDLFFSGRGDDALAGGAGDDVYYYQRGDGHDAITETYNYNAGTRDRLVLSDISAEEVTVVRDGSDLLLRIAGSDNAAGSIRLSGQFNHIGDTHGVERVEFADGTAWTQQQMREQALAAAVTAGDDQIVGSDVADELRGGRGNDVLAGGAGDDVYYYQRGDGHDAITESYNYNAGTRDRLVLSDISAEEVTVVRDGSDLLLRIAGSDNAAGSIRLSGQFNHIGDTQGIESVMFADDMIWSKAVIQEKALAEVKPINFDADILSVAINDEGFFSPEQQIEKDLLWS